MKKSLLFSLISACLCFSTLTYGQSAIIRGEASAGVYENLSSTSQRLNVNTNSSGITPAAAADATANPTIGKDGAYNFIFNGTTWDRQRSATGTVGVTSVNIEGTKTTYAASIIGLVAAGAATDIFYISGSATRTVRVNKIRATATQTVSGIIDISLVKRSTANSGGTCATVTTVPLDSANAAGTAIVTSCTANPTTGSLVGNVRSEKLAINVATTTSVDEAFWRFGDVNGQAVTLRGTAQVLAVNLNGATLAGNFFDISIEWTEE